PHQRRLDRALIGRAVVDTSNAAAVAGIVVEGGLDDVRLDPDVGHPGGDGPANVVDTPRPNDVGEPLVQILLAPAPRGKAAVGAVAEEMIAIAGWYGLDDGKRCRR